MSDEWMQAAMKELQESMVILTHIDKVPRVKRGLAQPNIQSEKLWARIDKNLAEITEKLNRLTGPQ